MHRLRMNLPITALLWGLAVLPGQATPPDPALGEQAFAVFGKYCYRCHGKDGKFEAKGLDILNYGVLVNTQDKHYIVPEQPAKSRIWKKIDSGSMPPKEVAERPTAADKDLLEKWIEAGAPAPLPPGLTATTTPPISGSLGEKEVLTAIRDHLRQTPQADRRFQRYFTLAHLRNNPAVKDRDLRLSRAALSKVANSLSWENDVTAPRAIDKVETVFAIDLRDLGWDRQNLWADLLQAYPYGLSHDTDRDPVLRDLFNEVVDLSDCPLPYLRADWFVASASRPPLYHTMLRLPDNAADLERSLRVDVPGDFLRDKLVRGGFPNSNISAQNRMVERHRSAYGAYWKSYDFKPKNPRSNLFELPLGPVFKDNPFPRQAFAQDGGEIIFNLPNGLQGYLLVDKNDKRINEGPTDVVGDSTKASGTTVVVNGVSCMTCHSAGMKPFQDGVRSGSGVAGAARLKVEQLYPEQKKLDALLKEDEDRFMKAIERATAPFLKVGADARADLRDFDEPVRALVDLYQKDLGPAEVACELDIRDPKQLQDLVKANRELQSRGLGPLADGRPIKREEWETIRGTSGFQSAAQKLGKGTALRPLKSD